MEIFDAYVQDLIAQEKAKEKETGVEPKVGLLAVRLRRNA